MTLPTISGGPLDRDQADRLALPLQAITDRARLQILSILAATPDIRPVDMQEPLGLTQPTISHHVRILRAAGLVTSSRGDRTSVLLRLTPGALDELAAAIIPGGMT